MNIVAILIAAAVAVSASRLPHTYNFGYYDSSPYFESPPSLPLRSSFLSSSSSKQEPSFKNSQSISVNDDILKDGSPSDFQEERNFFDFSSSTSSHLSLRKPHSFYQDGLSSYQEDQFNAQDYRGPPPPIFKEVFRKQMFPVKNESFYNSTEERIAKYPKEHTNQQPVTTEYRQSLSSAGDEHFIDNGNHGLGFASIVGVTSPNINPLDVVEITSTTKAAMELPSMKVMHTSLTNGVQTSHQTRVQQHLMATHSLNSDILPSAVTSMPLPKAARDSSYIQTSTNLESKLHDLESTTPATMKLISMVPQSNLASVQNLSNPISENTIMFPKSSKPLFDFRSRSQEFSATTHKQLPIGSLGPNVNLHHGNQNFLLYETKNNFPFQPTDFQIYKKHQNNDNIVPLRFSLPTTSTSTTLSRSTIPVNFVYQIVDFTRSPLPFITGFNTNSFTPEQNKFGTKNFNKINSATNLESTISPYIFLQNSDHSKLSAEISSNVPLGSFHILRNDGYSKQGTESNFDYFLDGKEYIQPNNFVSSRSTVLGTEKFGINIQEPFRLPESMYAKIGFDQNAW